MIEDQYEPTKAERLAALVTGNASTSYMGASVQRSHRFPLHLFIQIENMARLGGMSISSCINELIESGLEAVKKELPKEIVDELTNISREQIERPTKVAKVESHPPKGRRGKSSKS